MATACNKNLCWMGHSRRVQALVQPHHLLHRSSRTDRYHHHHHHHYRPTATKKARCYFASASRTFADDDQASNASRRKSKRVVFLGTPEVAAETLATLYAVSSQQQPQKQPQKQPQSLLPPFEISLVVTQPPRRGKRHKVETSPVQRAAEAWGIPVYTPEKANDPKFLDAMEALEPDLCITAAYGQYLPNRFLQCATFGTINIHPSLLPKWRGASPVQRSLQYGDNPLGVSILYTVQRMDAGPIIAQQEYSLKVNGGTTTNNNNVSSSSSSSEDENATKLLPELFRIGTNLLLENLPGIFNGEMTMDKALIQDESRATMAPLIQANEAQVSPWEESAMTILKKMRAFSMWPQTYCYMQVGETRSAVKVKLLEARVNPNEVVEPTTIVKLGDSHDSSGTKQQQQGLRLVCYDGSVLEILRLCPATRNACPARDFQNGYPNETIRWVHPPSPL